MDRNRLALLLSVAALATVIAIWLDLFVFGKVSHSPEWAAGLPPLLSATDPLVLASLLPATFIPSTLKSSGRVVLQTLLLSPVPGLLVFALTPSHQHSGLLFNVLFNYFWIVALHCLVPALVLFGIRAVFEGALAWLSHRKLKA